MTRGEYDSTLSEMEHVRALCCAATPVKKRRLTREYTVLWEKIIPYMEGEKSLSGE
jgi:hypothetical protein